MSGHGVTVSTSSTRTGSTVRLQRVEVYLVKSPGAPGTSHGIEGVDWSLYNGTLYVDFGTTSADGKITINIAAGQRYSLEALGTEYLIRLRTSAAEAVTTVRGQQRRLRMLGYQIGHSGTDKSGVDGVIGRATDRSILEFQVQKGVRFTGRVNSALRSSLASDAGV